MSIVADTSRVDGSFDEIPIVDLAAADASASARGDLVERIRAICHEVGFFVVVNHGVDLAFVDRVFSMMHDFFALPDEQKLLIDKRQSRHFRGWEAVGTEYTNNLPDIREQIDMWTDHPAGPLDAQPPYQRLLGPNQYLPNDVLAGHRDLSLQWFDELGGLASRLLGLLSLGLGLDHDHIEALFGEQTMSLSKFIHYPPTPEGQAGVNPHHDAGFLTVLVPGPTPGLQVRNGRDEYVPVPDVPGGFVINLGEMMQGITGNYFVATPHRVVAPSERYSAGYFHGPSLDMALSPIDLDPMYAQAVAASPRHSSRGYMARREETEAGVGEMQSDHRPATYGEQLWNYFSRSYPEMVAAHYPEAV